MDAGVGRGSANEASMEIGGGNSESESLSSEVSARLDEVYQERIVKVPQIQSQERIVYVPKVKMQEREVHVPKIEYVRAGWGLPAVTLATREVVLFAAAAVCEGSMEALSEETLNSAFCVLQER